MTVVQASEQIHALAKQCVEDVENAIGIALDFSVETLPLLEHYCLQNGKSEDWQSKAQALATMGGSYLGEVLRRVFPCRWHVVEGAPYEWRLEFEDCFLCFNPLGMVLELLLDGEAHGWNASFVTGPGATDPLREHLASLPGVSEDDFYSLAVRHETLEIAHAFLFRWYEQSGDGPPACRPEDYAKALSRNK